MLFRSRLAWKPFIYTEDVEECFKEILEEIENFDHLCINSGCLDELKKIIKDKLGFEE